MAQFGAGQNPKIFGRGGRLRRSAIGVATFAPALAVKLLASVSSFGLGAVVTATSIGGQALAQNCLSASPGQYTCYGAITSTRSFSRGSAASLDIVVTLSSNLTANVASGDAFVVENFGAGADITITQQANGGNISAARHGFVAKQTNGSGGGITINLTGDVEGKGGRGIYARSTGSLSDKGISITAQAVSGQTDGIYTNIQASGQGITIVANGDVEGKTSEGIRARNNGGGDVSITAGNVSGSSQPGISISRFGSGKVVLTSTGTVTGTGSRNSGVQIYSYDGSGESVTLNNVSATRSGVSIRTRRANDFQLSVTGTISTGNGGDGIRFNRYVGGTGSTTITVNAIDAEGDGIHFTENDSSLTDGGNVSITASGHVHGANSEQSDGIFVSKGGKGDVIIRAVQVTGGKDGIEVHKYDTGSIDISVSGDILGECGATTSTGDCSDWGDAGIFAYSDNEAENISIAATASADVTGSYGIRVSHEGTGTVTIETAGNVLGDGRDGIFVKNIGGDDVDDRPVVDITAKNVESFDDGIHVYSDSAGEGGVSIEVSESGQVYGDGHAIYVESVDQGDIKVVVGQSAEVTSDDNLGIGVSNYGRGDVSITASPGSMIKSFWQSSGNVNHITGDNAIWVFNSDRGGTVNVNISGDVQAVGQGIYVYNKSNESTTITMNGSISKAGPGGDGIYVNALGSGNVSVTVSGDIAGGGELPARTVGAGTREGFRFRKDDFSYADYSWYFQSYTLDIPEVTIAARSGYAINLNSINTGTKKSGSGAVTLTIDGGTISAATGGGAIKNGDGSSSIFLNSGATINGKVSLGGGVDAVQINGGALSSTTVFDGGEDSGTDTSLDIITFSGGQTAVKGSNLLNWERIALSNSATVNFSGTDTLSVGQLIMATGTELSMSDGTAGDSLTLTGNFTGDGVVKVDVDIYNGTADTITINGDLTGTKVLNVSAVTPDNPSGTPASSILIATVTGQASETALTFRRTVVSGRTYGLVYNSTNKTFVLTGQQTVSVCDESNTVPGQFTCTGNISVESTLNATGTGTLNVTLASSATADINAYVLFAMNSQSGGITFTQEPRGRTLNGTGSATGIISAQTTGDSPVSITLTGNATLAGSGTVIYARSTGTGNISIVVAGVTAAHGSATGIHASGAGTSVAVTAADVNGGQAGIVAANSNSAGSVTISANGTVTSLATAIEATTSGTSISINTSGAVTGSATAIKAVNNGTGSTASIAISARSIVSGVSDHGIYAMNKGSGSLTITAGAVSGSTSAITAKADGASNVSINASGIVTSSGTGIHAESKGGSVSVSTTLALATNVSGIVAINSGTGAGGVSVNAANSVTANTGQGIHASNSGNGNISVTATTITGSGYGVFAQSTGTGNISIRVSSAITSAGVGIYAEGKGSLVSVIASGNITGATGGIDIISGGSGGAVVLNATGSINGGANKAISVVNQGSGATQVNIGSATGFEAIDVLNQNGGTVSLATTGAIVGNGATGNGIKVVADSEGGDMTVNVAASSSVQGPVDGVYLRQQGMGAINLVTAGPVTGSASDGIRVRTVGTAAVITASTVSAAEVGIYFSEAVRAADRVGVSTNVQISVTSGSTVTAGTMGVKARAGAGDISMTVSGTVTAQDIGAYLLSDGSGDVTVTLGSSAAVTGSKGIFVKKIPTEGEIVNVGLVTLNIHGTVTGSTKGVHVDADTPQMVSFAGDGEITGTTEEGILAVIDGAGGVTMGLGSATGLKEGILIDNNGGGSISISSTGKITATGTGYSAVSLTTSGTAVSITVNEVEGTHYGIFARNEGASATSITVNGELKTTGTGAKAGIYAYGGQDVKGLSVKVNSSGSVAGNEHGIHLRNTGTGANITIDTEGAVTSTGTAILAKNEASNKNIMVTISGNVTGGEEQIAIDTDTNGGTTTIVINSGTISAPNGHAIRNNGGVSTVTVNSGTTIASDVNLGGGVDTLILGGGTFGTGITVDGGSDGDPDNSIDVLQFGAGTTALSVVTASTTPFTNFEQLVIASGATATSDGAATLSGYNVVLQGTLSMQDGAANDTLTISGNLAGGGTLSIDVNFNETEADVLTVTGNVSGSTRIQVTQIGSSSLVASQDIPVVRVSGSASADSFALVGGTIEVDGIDIGLTYRNKVFYLDLSNAGLFNLKTLAAAFPVSVLEGFARAPTLAQRRGDSMEKARNFRRGFWFTPDSGSKDFGTLSARNSYDTSITGYQAGYDIPGTQNEQGGWLYSVTTQWRQFETDVTSIDGTGGISSEGYGVGVTATWYGKNGSYMDLQGQYNRVGADFKGGRQGTIREDAQFNTWFASFEFGQRYEIYENVSLVPQGQFSWGQFHGDSVVGKGVPVTLRFDDERSIIARLGLGLEYTEDEFHAYAIGDLIHDTLDEWKTSVNGAETTDQLGSLSSEIGGGFSYTVSDEADIFMRATYKFSFDSDDREHSSTYVSAGIRWAW